MNNQADVSMLNEVFQNASMGARGTELLIEKTDDSQFSNELHGFLNQYTAIKNDAANHLSQLGKTPQDISATDNASLWMGVQFNTLIDKTPSHMAEMLIQGGTMGIIKGVKDLNSNTSAAPPIRELTDRLVKLEQSNIDAMKRYLS